MGIPITEQMAPEIIVEKKYGEFHVHLKDRPGCWAQGKTIMHAVGTLICDHPDAFNISINYDGVDSLSPETT